MIFKPLLLFFFFLIVPMMSFAQVTHSLDASSNLKTWKLEQDHFELQLVQRLPDQTRGFFQGRGFSKQQANDIATQCVLQTIIKNTAPKQHNQAITVSLKDWHIDVVGQRQGIKLKEDWEKQWSAIKDENLKVKKSARTAFKWATFPSEQTFQPGGDYNWGMISFGLKPGQKFDLQVIWKLDEELKAEWIRGIECPKDI